jgi:hypothetical protein
MKTAQAPLVETQARLMKTAQASLVETQARLELRTRLSR